MSGGVAVHTGEVEAHAQSSSTQKQHSNTGIATDGQIFT